MFSAEFLYFNCPGAKRAHCASLAPAPDGGLLAAWYVYPEEETRDARIVLARKPSDDAPWSEGSPVQLGVQSSVGNPVLFTAPDGTVWLHFVALRGRYWDKAAWHAAPSRDGGRSFGPAAAMSPEDGLMVRHPPTVANDGRAVLPVYSDRTKESFVYEALPPYGAWRRTHGFGAFPVIQGSVVAPDADRLIAFFRPSDNPRNSWRSVSNDTGRTWSEPVRMTLPNPMSGIAAFVLGERVGLVYNHTHEHQRHPLSVSWSTGPLNDWSEPRSIDDAGFEVSYPSVLVDGHNQVHVAYTYNRRFIKYVRFDAEWLADGNA